MFKVKVLNNDDVKKVLEISPVIDTVEKVYKLKAENKTEVFPLIFHDFNRNADMDIKSGCIDNDGIYGMKLVSWFGDNVQKGLPDLIGVISVFDANTGAPLGILSASYITCMRTGAAGAIGAKYLAREESEDLLIIGAGHQATYQIAATLIVMKNIKNVRVYDPINSDNAKNLVNRLRKVIIEELKVDVNDYVNFEAVEDIENAVKKSDIIITVTPSRSPLVKKEWVKKGTHFSCVGSDMSGKQEIDENIFKEARVFVDDLKQCAEVGEIEIPIKKEIISQDDIIGEIGELINKKVVGRRNNEEITVFDTTGMALQDLATSKIVLDVANEKNIGQDILL